MRRPTYQVMLINALFIVSHLSLCILLTFSCNFLIKQEKKVEKYHSKESCIFKRPEDQL